MEVLAGLVSGLAGAAYEVFGYNRKNFQYDRRQRTIFEYQLSEMRIKQADLWREDVRDAIQLTPKKMEIYLLVIAMELTGAGCCLCKGRIPPGAPPWMVAAGVLAVCSCISYLFLALWFGLHAFVAAQAYKVRILTQLVRLPIPSWSHMEAARTYGSDFESMPKKQMLRVPFVTGSQEGWAGSGEAGEDDSPQMAADPWGLERRGEGLSELDPNVNHDVEKQRHVWLIRESAKFFNTYDAFCRVSMSAGTSSLATFFCFYCLAYVCTELAAPVGAWAGMFVFCGITLLLLRTDQILSGKNYLVGSIFLFFSPVFCAVVTFMSSKHWGNPGSIEYLVPIGLFLKGCWFLYYLHVFHCKEHQTGAVLPRSFRAVLYVDPYGWAMHTSHWWERIRGRSGRNVASAATGGDGKHKLPATTLASGARPMRPEDARHEAPAVTKGPLVANPADLPGDEDEDEDDDMEEEEHQASLRPGTFSNFKDEHTEDAQSMEQQEAGDSELVGDRAGLQPWRAFFFNTVMLAVMWWCASFVAFYDVYYDIPEFTKAHYGLRPGEVEHMHHLLAEKVETGWGDEISEPHGFSCSPDGTVFATLGRIDGKRSVLRGRADEGGRVRFEPAPDCSALAPSTLLQDLAVTCHHSESCHATVLPLKGDRLLSCPLFAANGTTELAGGTLGREWLEDRGGSPLDENSGLGHLLHPEEVTSLGTSPCPAKFEDEQPAKIHDCLVVGTTARRLVQLGRGLSQETWLPRRLLQRQAAEVPGPGAFAVLGRGRFLGVLHRDASTVRLLDLATGGREHASWVLPRPPQDSTIDGLGHFAGICAGKDALYALQAGPSPSVWRFRHPQVTIEP